MYICKQFNKFTHVFLFGIGLVSSAAFGQAVLKVGTKSMTLEELGPAAQASWYDYEYEEYLHKQSILENKILDLYFEQEATKKKKAKKEISEAEMKTPELKEADLKKFYEEKKAQIPYPFEQVKGEIQNILGSQRRQEHREKLVKKAMAAIGASILLEAPLAPVVKINTDGFHRAGKQGAKVQLVEFADYQCPHCKTASVELKKIKEKYKDKIDFVYIDYAFNSSGISKMMAIGAYCASKQNKFWEYHELTFQKQSSLSKTSMVDLAKELKLDQAAFASCAASPESTQFVERGKEEGDRVGVSGTPAIFLNGKRYRGISNFESLSKEIDGLLK